MSAASAIVTGASGQDGYFLTERLLREGTDVFAITRRPSELLPLSCHHLHIVEVDLLDDANVIDLIARVQADEVYNLAGISSVAASFSYPRLAWSTNVDAVVTLLDAVRLYSPHTRVYQASSSEMFGFLPNESVVHDEYSALRPASPYAAAKAAAHLLCQSYRESFGIRVACGILFNHESHRRPEGFLTRKIADHTRSLIGKSQPQLEATSPLELGNLKARRDWGYAPDYIDGIVRVARQTEIRAQLHDPEPDVASSYRDYVLGTGSTRAVWELVDCAYHLVGIDLEWYLEGDNPEEWHARLREGGIVAVTVNPDYLRPNDPAAIQADPTRASRELGWHPNNSIKRFMTDMLYQTRDTNG